MMNEIKCQTSNWIMLEWGIDACTDSKPGAFISETRRFTNTGGTVNQPEPIITPHRISCNQCQAINIQAHANSAQMDQTCSGIEKS